MDKKELQFGLDLLLADKLLNSGYFDNTRCVNWAISLMNRGVQSDYVYILAGLDTNDSYAVEYYMKKLIEDLGLIGDKTPIDLFQLYLIDIAQQVIGQKISPDEGLYKFCSIRIYGYNYDFSTELIKPFADLAESISLIGEYQLFYANLTEKNKEEAILNEMKLLLLKISKGISCGRELVYCNVCNDFTAIKTFDKGWFLKTKKHACEKCESADFISWNNVSNQKKILELFSKQ